MLVNMLKVAEDKYRTLLYIYIINVYNEVRDWITIEVSRIICQRIKLNPIYSFAALGSATVIYNIV